MGATLNKMVKFLKDGKIVVILQTDDEGGKERSYGHCVVAGVAKAPLPITKAMCKPSPKMKKLVQRRSCIKTFVKIVNYTHVMPTRYSVENQMVKTLKGNLTADTFTDQTAKKKFLKATRTVFEDKYKERDGQRWLFEKLRF